MFTHVSEQLAFCIFGVRVVKKIFELLRILQLRGNIHNYLPIGTTYHRILYTWVRVSWIEFNNCPTRCDLSNFFTFLQAALHVSGVDTHHQELVQLWLRFMVLINRIYYHPLSLLSWNWFMRIVHVWYAWISSNLTTRADGSRSGYVKTILLI